MNKIILFFISLFLLSLNSTDIIGQQRASDMINFANDEYNFGKIPQGKPVFYEFKFENKQNKPVIVENVLTSCGCTTPEWDKSPIAPGKKSAIKVGYNAASEGNFQKSIQVFVKDSNVPHVLRISGEVVKAEAAPVANE